MARRRTSNAGETLNAWPGFVDALSTLLMVIIFVLLVFVLAQAFLSVALSGRDQALTQLHRKIAEMSNLLALEHGRSDTLQATLDRAKLDQQAASAEKDSLQRQLATLRLDLAKAGSEQDRLSSDRGRLSTRLDDETLRLQAAEARNAALQSQLSDSAKRSDDLGQTAAAAAAQLLDAQRQVAAARDEAAATATTATTARDRVEQQAREAASRAATAEQQGAALSTQLAEKSKLADDLQVQIASLSDEMRALREQLAAVGTALDASEASGKDKDVQITNLGSRLNIALAQKIGELQQYRSEFFGQLRQVLANQPGVQVVGDRFVFQSEVLFPPGKPDLSPSGLQQIAQLARTLKEIIPRIPTDINWLLRVDGHADRQSVVGTQYPSNLDLSAARAIKVVQLLAAEGVPANRLAATAFGEYQPIDLGNTTDAYAKNRRIEIRLTDR